MHDELTTELKQRINTFQAWKYYIIPKFENKEKIVFLTSASHWKQQYVKILSLILEKKNRSRVYRTQRDTLSIK